MASESYVAPVDRHASGSSHRRMKHCAACFGLVKKERPLVLGKIIPLLYEYLLTPETGQHSRQLFVEDGECLLHWNNSLVHSLKIVSTYKNRIEHSLDTPDMA